LQIKISVHNDVCLDYKIDSGWKATTIGENLSSPQRLFIGIPFSIPISSFTFATHALDLPTKCKNSFTLLDANNQPIANDDSLALSLRIES
jgi:hypothetical protein